MVFVSPLRRELGSEGRLSTPIARAYVLLILGAIFIFNAGDYSMLSILIQPIRKAFHLTDSASGDLIGLSFAVAYCTFSIPLGMAVDRYNRIRLVSTCLGVWSLCTAAFAFMSSYTQLVAARVGVAAGEAGAYSAAMSLVGDYFPAERRGFAMSCLQFCSMLGMMAGLALAGWIGQQYGWRGAFVAFGLCGLPLALLTLLTVPEPKRGAADRLASAPRITQSSASALRELWGRPAFRMTLMAMALSSIALGGSVAWVPSLLIRKFGLNLAESGRMSGMLMAIPSIAGTVVSGVCTDRLYRRSRKWGLWIPAISYGCAAMCLVIAAWTADRRTSFAALGVFAFAYGFSNIPIFAMTVGLSGSAMRGLASSLVGLLSILTGNGLGPAAIGNLSDLLAKGGLFAQPLGAAIALMTLPLFVSVYPLLRGAERIEGDLVRARLFDEGGLEPCH